MFLRWVRPVYLLNCSTLGGDDFPSGFAVTHNTTIDRLVRKRLYGLASRPKITSVKPIIRAKEENVGLLQSSRLNTNTKPWSRYSVDVVSYRVKRP